MNGCECGASPPFNEARTTSDSHIIGIRQKRLTAMTQCPLCHFSFLSLKGVANNTNKERHIGSKACKAHAPAPPPPPQSSFFKLYVDTESPDFKLDIFPSTLT